MSRTELFTTEADLDIHGVYEKAREARQLLDEKLTVLVNAKEKLRITEAKLTDREMFVASRYRGQNAEMSQTQFDKQVRWAINEDTQWLDLRSELNRLKGEVDALDADRSVLKRDIEIAVSRMNNLGGYFMYLASEKIAN